MWDADRWATRGGGGGGYKTPYIYGVDNVPPIRNILDNMGAVYINIFLDCLIGSMC